MSASKSTKSRSVIYRPLRAKLIFNAGSGRPEESPQQLANILSAMQDQQILPEVYTVRPDSQIEAVVHQAIKSGIRLIVVAGGDGTIDSVVGAMVGSDATLGIIPTGTRNNVAFNLGIDGDIASSVALLRQGRRLKIDVGRVHSGHSRHWFLEAAAIGLVSDLYPMADDIQHGNLTMIGELLSKFVSAAPSRLHMDYDGRRPVNTAALMMVITNMPFFGPHFQISPKVSFRDGRLDVFVFSDMTKLNVLSYAMLSQLGLAADVSIRHYRVKHARIRSRPRMPVLADGIQLGEGSLSVHIQPARLGGHGRLSANGSLLENLSHRFEVEDMNSDFKPAPLSADDGAAPFSSPSRRRPAFLLVLVVALILFLVWLPAGARSSLWSALVAQRGLLVLLLLFAVLTLSLVWAAGQRLDVWVFTVLNAQRYPIWLDRSMWLITQLGNMLSALMAALVLFLLHYRRLSIELMLGTLTLWLLVEMIKALSDRDRPFLTIEKTRVIGWREIGDSFPSGHTSQVFFLVTLFVYAFQLGVGASVLLYGVAALVGLTRIYVGAHYPRDVVAGMVLGSVWGILTTLVDLHWVALHL